MNIIIDDRIKGRVGSPILPVLPVHTVPVENIDDKIPSWPTHKVQIWRILDEEGILAAHGRKTSVAYRTHSKTELDDKHITITIFATYRPDSKTTWPKAVRRVREYLDGVGVHRAFEMMAQSLSDGLMPFPFLEDTYHWNDTIMPAVSKLLKGRNWQSLNLLNRDAVDWPGKLPVIIITASDADDKVWWDEILPAIRQLPEVRRYEIDAEAHYYERKTEGWF